MAFWRIASEGRTGQWVGKRLLKIRLVSAATGQPIGAGQALWRERRYSPKTRSGLANLHRPMSGPMNQTVADLKYGTMVVRVAEAGPSASIARPQNFAELAARQQMPPAPMVQAAPAVRVAPAVPPAAWFPDPSGARGLRWWNGVAWTEHTRPAG